MHTSGHSGSWGGAQVDGVDVRWAGGCVPVRTCGEGLGRQQKYCWGPLRGFKQLAVYLGVLPGSSALGVRSWSEPLPS